MKSTRDSSFHLRVDTAFKQQIEAAAAKLDIPPAAYIRMALREYVDRHGTTLQETGTVYTAPGKKTRNAAHCARTSFYAITRDG